VRLAVVGMGKMGHAFAERLLGGGHDVCVWNRTPHKADDLVARGAREAATPARAAAGADATPTSLANDDVVLGTVTGHEGVAAGLGDGVLIDASTVSPTRRWPSTGRAATSGRT
jgi:3-hydroxyisobutyrate dehydrogenase